MVYAYLIVAAMAVFACSAAVAFAWAVSHGQFRDLSDAAESIFWDEGGLRRPDENGGSDVR